MTGFLVVVAAGLGFAGGLLTKGVQVNIVQKGVEPEVDDNGEPKYNSSYNDKDVISWFNRNVAVDDGRGQ